MQKRSAQVWTLLLSYVVARARRWTLRTTASTVHLSCLIDQAGWNCPLSSLAVVVSESSSSFGWTVKLQKPFLHFPSNKSALQSILWPLCLCFSLASSTHLIILLLLICCFHRSCVVFYPFKRCSYPKLDWRPGKVGLRVHRVAICC